MTRMSPRADSPRRAEVHLWAIDLDVPGADVDALDPEEAERMARLRRPLDRARFGAAHAGARAILGAYLGRPPADVALEREPGGRPRLADGPLGFSLSRSGGLALLAITDGPEVGVDVERRRPAAGCGRIADAFFTPAEAARVHALDEPARSAAFLRLWTRKEAVLKACGAGIADGLDGWDADGAPPAGWRPGHAPPAGGNPGNVLLTAERPGHAPPAAERPAAERDPDDGWSVRDLPLPGHVAALATVGAREPRWLRPSPEAAR